METVNNIIVVDSRDRVSGTSSDFTWNLPNIITLKKHKGIMIHHVSMINSFYQINANNNTILFDEGTGSVTATLTQGNSYTEALLCAEIKTQMEAIGAFTYTVSINSINHKMTISATGNFDLVLSRLEICDIIGFSKDNTSYTGLNTYTGTNCVNINSAIDTIYVYIKELHGNIYTSNYIFTFLISNDVNNMDYINFTQKAYFDMGLSTGNIVTWTNWNIKLFDHKNREITVGTEWNFKISIIDD